MAETFKGLRKRFSKPPRLLHVTVQSGSVPVMRRKTWSALVLMVVVVPFTERVSTPASSARERRSALPGLDTRDVVPVAVVGALNCWSIRACPASDMAVLAVSFDWARLRAPCTRKSVAATEMKLNTAFGLLRSSLLRNGLASATVLVVPAFTLF